MRWFPCLKTVWSHGGKKQPDCHCVDAVCCDLIIVLFNVRQVMWAAAARCMGKPSHQCRTPQRCSGWSATVRPQLLQTSPACRLPCTAARRTSVRGELGAAVLDLRVAGAPMTPRLTWTASARKDSFRQRKRSICQPKLSDHASLSHPCKVGPVDPNASTSLEVFNWCCWSDYKLQSW